MASELRAELAEKGLATTGSKALLEERLHLTQDWSLFETVYVLDYLKEPYEKSKISAYDLDHTLVEPTTNKLFSEGLDDWKFKKDMLEQVKEEQSRGHLILIFSNQSRKANRHITLGRIARIAKVIDNCAVFVATGHDVYRKPEIGMWDLATELLQLTPLLEDSYYCGDASGLEGSFSDSDAEFARNLGIEFKLPLDSK